MSAVAAAMLREFFPRNAAKEVARRFGVSIDSGRRYVEHPDLFPRRRAEQLLAVLEQEQAEAERRIAERRQKLEALRDEVRSAMGLSGPRLDLERARDAVRHGGGAAHNGGAVVPPEGR